MADYDETMAAANTHFETAIAELKKAKELAEELEDETTDDEELADAKALIGMCDDEITQLDNIARTLAGADDVLAEEYAALGGDEDDDD